MMYTPEQEQALGRLLEIRDSGVSYRLIAEWAGLPQTVVEKAGRYGSITQENAEFINGITAEPPEPVMTLAEKVREEWPHIYACMGSGVATVWRLHDGLIKPGGGKYDPESIYLAAVHNGFDCPRVSNRRRRVKSS